MSFSVTLVEFSEGMMNIAKKTYKELGLKNLYFKMSEAQKFLNTEKYQLIWISGLLIYLSDDELRQLISNCRKMLASNGLLLLRDGTGLKKRYEINNQFSKDLNSNYSATYRSAEEYEHSIKNDGFKLIKQEDVFDDPSC